MSSVYTRSCTQGVGTMLCIRMYRYCLLVTLAVTISCILLYHYSLHHYTRTYWGYLNATQLATQTANNATTKIIYIWNRQHWLFAKFGPSKRDFQEAGCPVYNCRLVDEDSYPRGRIHRADSVLFTIRDFFYKDKLPRRTRLDQIWTIWHREAQLHSHPIEFSVLNDFFNLTFTHMNHPDTDIYSPMGGTISRPPQWKYRPQYADVMAGKTKMVAWVVSNCHSKGQRTQYVRELSKYVPVDIYGKCGMGCPHENNSCFEMISREYKFYLSFESMYCEEYITEKMFRPLQDFIVPVALGGANYSAVLPAHSHIDVRNFTSPRDLAGYLKYLDQNEQQYLEYFAWKEKYLVKTELNSGLCDLCRILHTQDYPYKTGFQFDVYWDPDVYCKHGREERMELHLDPDEHLDLQLDP